MMTPRETVLLRGLEDWVALDRVHWDVSQYNQGAALTEIQERTLELIGSLVTEGLCELGDLANDKGVFVPWETPIDTSLSRIREVYVIRFEDQNVWPWYCWLNLTSAGEAVAQAIEAKQQPWPWQP